MPTILGDNFEKVAFPTSKILKSTVNNKQMVWNIFHLSDCLEESIGPHTSVSTKIVDVIASCSPEAFARVGTEGRCWD
jgi:hypothetical protein